jgi:hypothetical protein
LPACVNHPAIETERACAACRQPFCPDCLVEMSGQPLCGACKNLSVRDLQRRAVVGDKPAHDAFMYSLLGICILGPIIQPIALYKGIKALEQYRENPSLPNRWKAVTAIVISSVMIAFYVIYFGAIAFFAIQNGGR